MSDSLTAFCHPCFAVVFYRVQLWPRVIISCSPLLQQPDLMVVTIKPYASEHWINLCFNAMKRYFSDILVSA